MRDYQDFIIPETQPAATPPPKTQKDADAHAPRLSDHLRILGDADILAKGYSDLRKIDPDWAWQDPDWSLLDDRRGALPDFPLDALPEAWQTWVKKSARGAGVTPAHVMGPVLGVASSLIGTARRVRASKSWSEPFSTWTSTVGFSGTGKTPGLDVSRLALAAIERSRKYKLGELQRAHETRVETAKAAAKKWKAEVEEAVDQGRPSPPMPPNAAPPVAFIPPRLHSSDATIERLAELLQARCRGMLLLRDELAGLFLNMSRYSNGSDREFWLESWNGKFYVVERKGSPPVTVDHLLIGVTGGFQPDKLARSFAGDDDGMYARILFSWPSEPAFQALSDDVTEVDPEFQTALMRLIDLPDSDGETFLPRDVPLSDSARNSFEQFRQFLHTGKASLEGREREWWAKGATHVLRLAGTLCYLDWAMPARNVEEPKEIGNEFVTAAVRLWHYFWPHARASLRQVGINEQHADARRVLKWAEANRKAELSVMDVRRDALKQQLDADKTEALLDRLVRVGWLKKITEKTRGRARHRWVVNPQLLSSEGAAGTAASAESPDPHTLPAVPALPAEGSELDDEGCSDFDEPFEH